MIWPAFIAEIEARALTHLPAGDQAAVRAVMPFGDAGLTVLWSCGTSDQLTRGAANDHRLGAVVVDGLRLDGAEFLVPESDPDLVPLGALLAGEHPSPLLGKLTVMKARIRSWRPRRRAQVELTVADSPVAYFAKLERPTKVRRWEQLRAVLAEGFTGSPALAMAEPAGGDAALGLSIAKEVLGVPLAHVLAGGEALATLHRIGRALRDLELFAVDPRLVSVLPVHDFAAAHADLDRFTRLLERFELPTAELVTSGLALLGTLGERDSGRRALIHRDLHDGQVIVGSRITLLDLEGVRLGDPALDFGNLLAHLRLRHLQGRLEASPGNLGKALLAGHGADESAGWLRAVNACEALSLFRLAAVYDLRPRWRHLGIELALAGHAVLARIESPVSTAATSMS